MLTRLPKRRFDPFEDRFRAELVAGGDRRIDLDPATRLNQYLVGPEPDDFLVSFASTTANTISRGAYEEALSFRASLGQLTARPATALVEPFMGVAAEISGLLGLCAEVAVVPVASGTDGVLYATWLAARDPVKPAHAILVGGVESGSGVPLAARGLHHADRTPSGESVGKASPALPVPRDVTLEDVPIRDAAGRPVSVEQLDERVRAAVLAAAERGRRVLLHRLEGSKTGLVGPSLTLLDALTKRLGDDFTVLVDACQMRVDPAMLRDHLARGHMVLITGSKFLGGPPFSGALLVPRAPRPLPTLPGYVEGTPRNLGLLLRWRAALYEWRRFAAREPSNIRAAAGHFHAEARRALGGIDRLRWLDEAPIPSWLGVPTILSFTIEGTGGRLSPAGCKAVRDALALPCLETSERFHIGQPVPVGADVGALRVALDARLLAELTQPTREAAALDALRGALERLRRRLALVLAD